MLRCSDEVAVGIKELEPGIESTGHRAHANDELVVLLTTEAEDIHVTEGGDGPFRVGVIGNGFRTGFIVLSALQGKPIVSGRRRLHHWRAADRSRWRAR